MDRWEYIARRLLVLCNYGYGMEFFDKYIDNSDFLSVRWLEWYYGDSLPDYVILDLEKVEI